MTPKRDKLFHTPVGTFSYRHLAISKYREGVELLWLSPKRSVFMASPEKALIDYIVLNKVSVPKSVDSAKIFLEEDLRIDSESWKRFNVSLINRLNRVYKCKAVDVVAQVFERIKP